MVLLDLGHRKCNPMELSERACGGDPATEGVCSRFQLLGNGAQLLWVAGVLLMIMMGICTKYKVKCIHGCWDVRGSGFDAQRLGVRLIYML
jgi:hypothetical protein